MAGEITVAHLHLLYVSPSTSSNCRLPPDFSHLERFSDMTVLEYRQALEMKPYRRDDGLMLMTRFQLDMIG